MSTHAAKLHQIIFSYCTLYLCECFFGVTLGCLVLVCLDGIEKIDRIEYD